MERITLRQPIAEALDLLPAGIRRRVEHTDFLTGVSPIFAGLHHYIEHGGVRYDRAAHVAWLHHQAHLPASRRRTTVVLPRLVEIHVVVHELGHVLDEQIGYGRHIPDPVSTYAQTDTWEAFAEAFEAWIMPPELADPLQDASVLRADKQTLAFFAELAE